MVGFDLKYSCFISYRHPQNEYDLTKSFVEDLKTALKTYLGPLMSLDVFIDEERLKPGYLFKEALAEAICQSVCLIVVYTPKYFDESATYCAREYKAMLQLEVERKQFVPNRKIGFIIPVVFRGPNEIPSELKNDRLYCDFSEYTLVESNIMLCHG
jgi:hypothetical protein